MSLLLYGLLFAALIAIFMLLTEAGSGRRWITLSMHSDKRAQTIWTLFENGWRDHALTFKKVTASRDINDRSKVVTVQAGGRRIDITMERLPSKAPMEICVTCTGVNGRRLPAGEHVENWHVQPDGMGCIITASLLTKASPTAVLRTIFQLREQLSIIARGENPAKPPLAK